MEAYILSQLQRGALRNEWQECADGERLFEVVSALLRVAMALSEPKWEARRAEVIGIANALMPRLRTLANKRGVLPRSAPVAATRAPPLPGPKASQRLTVRRGKA